MVVVTNESEFASALASGTKLIELGASSVITISKSYSIIASGTTISSADTSKKGELRLKEHCGWSSGIPMLQISGRSDIVFDNVIISANYPNQQGEPRGKGYFNLCNLRSCANIVVRNCILRDGGNDGFQFRGCRNIRCYDNTVSYLGHDVFYFLGSNSDIQVYRNKVLTFTNSAVRLSYGCTDAWIYNNHFYSVFTGGSTGPAIEIDKHGFSGILIENNYIHDVNGAAIWMPADAANNGSIIIRNNIIVNTGVYKSYTGYSNAAIVNGGMNGVVIKNNTIVGGNVAYATFDRNGLNTTYSVDFSHNIVVGAKLAVMRMSDAGGSVRAESNCLWNNEAVLIGSYTSKVTLVNTIGKSPALDSEYKRTSATPAGVGAGATGTAPQPEPDPIPNTEPVQRTQEDTRMREASPTAVYETTPYLDVGASTSSVRSLIYYDLSALTAPVHKAVLRLCWYYPANKARDNDTIVDIYRPIGWTAKTATWNNAGRSWYDAAGATNGGKPFASKVFTASTIPDNKYHDFDVTELVNAYISGKYVNSGFLLKASQELNNYIAFYSMNWSDVNAQPKLVITEGAPTSVVKVPITNFNRFREDAPTTVLDTTPYLDVGKSTRSARFMVFADLSKFTKPVESASLDLSWYYPAGKSRISDTIIHAYRTGVPAPAEMTWASAGANWVDAENIASGNVPYGSVTLKAAILPDGKFEHIDITKLVNEYIAGTYENTGIFIKALIESGNYVAFHSTTAVDGALRPTITVSTTETII